mmetsp:Transcript_60723/g.113500  ORF Transcript_60723/g.113500 Transcript_60723/m.113500 type:complete len:346 (-) Transcript_60723:19-1056(-)
MACHKSLKGSAAVLFLLWFADTGFPNFSFSQPRRRQTSLSMVRQQTGQSASVPVLDKRYKCELFEDEPKLITSISSAGRKGDWMKVLQLWRSYTGTARPVYCAVMQAAQYCGHYKEAAEIYDQLRELRIEVDTVTLHLALKVFGKLRNQERVLQIWSEAAEKGWIDPLFVGARIDASADMGDIPGAAEALDYGDRKNLSLGIVSFNSALNACKNADPPSHSAAMYLFDELQKRGLQPDVITFTNLAQAHRRAPVARIEFIRTLMDDCGIAPNRVFAEAYLGSLFGRFGDVYTAKDMASKIEGLPNPDRRKNAARAAIESFKSHGIRLTSLCELIDQFLCEDISSL